MHPDKRRIGRAIRKQRREAKEAAANVDVDAVMEAWTNFAETVMGGLAEVFAAWGKAFTAVAEAIRTTPRRNHFALLPSAGGAELSEAPTGDPSQSGVHRVTEAHSASEDNDPFEGIGDY